MKITPSFLLAPALAAAILATGSPTARAEVFQTVDKTYQTDAAPIDLASAADGSRTFILTEGGKVHIQMESGERHQIAVDPGMDRIFTDATGGKIYLSSRATKKVQEIFVDFLQNIDISGSPSLGSPNAPVVLAVFSDFE